MHNLTECIEKEILERNMNEFQMKNVNFVTLELPDSLTVLEETNEIFIRESDDGGGYAVRTLHLFKYLKNGLAENES